MAKQSLEAQLQRRKLQDRRGVWTTRQGPGSWEATLLRVADGGSVHECLSQCPSVGKIDEHVTEAVLANAWSPPGGAWALLISTAATDWCHLAGPYRADKGSRALLEEFAGEGLQTGHQDTAGVAYVRVWKDGEVRFDFSTDGGPWERDLDEEEDEFELTTLTNSGFDARFDRDWMTACESLEAAHQELIAHLDAYVPGYWVDFRSHELGAFHSDAVSGDYITRIDVIHFGPQESSGETADAAASAALKTAIEAGDLAGVKTALSQGASLTKLPDAPATPLALACWHIETSKPETVEIIQALLAAGAVADDGGFQEQRPLEIVLSNAKAFPATLHQAIKLLTQHGADLNAQSGEGLRPGARPLQQAAAKGRLDHTVLLLHLGADPKLTNAQDQTPREFCEQTHERMKQQLGEENLRDQHLEYAKIGEALKQAEAGEIPPLEIAQPQIDALTAKIERHLAIMKKFSG